MVIYYRPNFDSLTINVVYILLLLDFWGYEFVWFAHKDALIVVVFGTYVGFFTVLWKKKKKKNEKICVKTLFCDCLLVQTCDIWTLINFSVTSQTQG